MKIGTYYYPEQWPREQWARDFDNIAAMGLQIVHMGEFAWYALEPEPGKFQFDWLTECIEMAAQHKLAVILCTPTAAPPIWLATQHPDTLPVDQHGASARFGGRRHYSPTSPALHEATRRIVTAMGQRFGDHPSVIGWQIDNEYSGSFDQSPQTHAAFRKWLEARYGSIDRLNQAWGCQFWNTYYQSFDQILMPPSRDPRYANPHQALDACRFWSHAFALFNRLQADILERCVGDRFITTNFMPLHPDVDPADLAPDLSLMSWDAYPVSGLEKNPDDETFRIADPAFFAFNCNVMSSYHNRWALMELQTGSINWSGVPVLVYPGTVRLWLWTAFAHGAEFTTTYRYRQPRFGIELYHGGLVGPDGVSPSPGGREFMQVIDEIKQLDLTRVPADCHAAAPASTVGLLFDFQQLWQFAVLPQARRWNQGQWLYRWYAAIQRLGLHVRIVHPDQPWPDDLPMLIAPALQMVDDRIVRRLHSYAEGGGHLVLTCRSAWMDLQGHLWEGPLAAPIHDMVGAAIAAYDSPPEGVTGRVELDDVEHDWTIWGELLRENEGTRVLARYANQFYAGAAAATQRPLGKGLVSYCGVAGHGSFIDALVEKLAYAAVPPRKVVSLLPGLPAAPGAGRKRRGTPVGPVPHTVLPPRVLLHQRGPYRILLNYRDQPVAAPAPTDARFLVGGPTVEPAGVAVWEQS